jgi:phage terminase Nu1 subunit (DNA packaging protein)
MGDQVKARALAKFFGVSEKTISELAKRGIIAPAGRGRYELEASVNSYCAYLRAMAASRGGDDATLVKTMSKGRRGASL